MNHDLLPLGWVHLIASLIAVGLGAVIIVRGKGTPTHRRWGRIYVLAVLATSITALGIYRLGVFFFAHWFGVAVLIVIVLGVMAAHFKIPQKGWTQLHLTCMLLSFYILIGGGVNEVFLRVAILRRLVRNFESPLIDKTHFAVIALFAVLIAYFNAISLLRGPSARA